MSTSQAPAEVYNPDSTAAKIASLKQALSAIDRTRSSLPSLLRSFSSPSTTSLERAAVYRSRANEAWTSIKALRDSLEAVAPVLQETGESEKQDGVDIVATQREVAGVGWGKLGEVLGDAGGSRKAEQFVRTLDEPKTPEGLEEMLRRWREAHPGVVVEVVERAAGSAEQRQLEVMVQGLMRAFCHLRWCSDRAGGRVVLVERVVCFSLREKKSSYLQSQFSIFQTVSNDGMKLVARTLAKAEAASVISSNVEEVLAFIAKPPLPW